MKGFLAQTKFGIAWDRMISCYSNVTAGLGVGFWSNLAKYSSNLEEHNSNTLPLIIIIMIVFAVVIIILIINNDCSKYNIGITM